MWSAFIDYDSPVLFRQYGEQIVEIGEIEQRCIVVYSFIHGWGSYQSSMEPLRHCPL